MFTEKSPDNEWKGYIPAPDSEEIPGPENRHLKMNPLRIIRVFAVKIINPLFKGNPWIMGFLKKINDRMTLLTITRFNGKALQSIKAAEYIEGRFGVNIAGYLTSESGIGEGARADVRAMEKAGISCALNDVSGFSRKGDGTYENLIKENNPYVFNLIHVNPDSFPLFLQEKGIDYLVGKYNIGFWVWELSEFPPEWSDFFPYINEIWTPSDFCADVFRKVSPVPVIKIPHSINVEKIKDSSRAHFGLKEEFFVFSFMFDFLSHFERKNPMAVLKAFKAAFRPMEKVQLVLKCSNSEYNPRMRDRMFEEAKGQNVKFIDGYLDKEELNALISLSDCYVSLHRSEGFGLPMAEAMYLGKPVIATNYSGNTEFMTGDNSFLVRHRLVEIEKDFGPYKKGNVWAEPDIDHAAELMRFVYENRILSRRVGEKASSDIKRSLSPEAVGRIILERLERIAKERRISITDKI